MKHLKSNDAKASAILAVGIFIEIIAFILMVGAFFINLYLGLVALFVWINLFGFLLEGVADCSGYFDKHASEAEENKKNDEKEVLVGKIGKAVSALRPMGTIEVDGQRVEAKSNLGLIEAHSPIVIISLEGRTFIVEPEKSLDKSF